MAAIGTGPLSGTLFKQYWNEKFLTELRSNLVLRDLGLMGTVPAGSGQIVHWLAMADLSVNATAATENKLCVLYKLLLNNLGTLRYC